MNSLQEKETFEDAKKAESSALKGTNSTNKEKVRSAAEKLGQAAGQLTGSIGKGITNTIKMTASSTPGHGIAIADPIYDKMASPEDIQITQGWIMKPIVPLVPHMSEDGITGGSYHIATSNPIHYVEVFKAVGEGHVSPRDISEATGIKEGEVSSILRRLVKEGIIAGDR